MNQFFEIAAKCFAYGHIGILIEFWFTGLYSVIIDKDKKASSYSYLWMVPVYGGAGIVLEAIQAGINWPWYAMAFVYVPVIYGIEAVSGGIIYLITGSIPWDYGKSHLSPLGLVNFRYLPFWWLLGAVFGPASDLLTKIIAMSLSLWFL